MVGIASAVAAIIASATSGIIRQVATSVLFFIALKVLLTTLFIIVLPIVLNNLLYDFLQTSMSMIDQNVIAGSHGMSFSGFMAWLAQCFKLPECLAISVSALQLHLILKMIPFSPVK